MNESHDPRRWWALALLGTAFFMVILDGTIVFFALPTIQEALGFSTSALQWVMSAYLLCFGGASTRTACAASTSPAPSR